MKIADPLADVGGQAADVGEQLDEVDLDVAGVGPAADGGGVDAGLPPVAQLGPGGGVALGERLDHAEHVVDVVALRGGRARGPPGAARRASGRRSAWSGRASSLPVPQWARTAAERRALSSTVLPTPRSPVSTIERSGRPRGDPLQHDVEGPQLLVAAGELGRALAGAGGVGVPDRVHDRSVWGCLARAADVVILRHRVAAPAPLPDRTRRTARIWTCGVRIRAPRCVRSGALASLDDYRGL